MSLEKQQFQTLLICGYARSCDQDKLHAIILKNCLMFYNNLTHEVPLLSSDMNADDIESKCHPQSWSNFDATTFNVRRGPNYTDGQKEKSKPSMYEIFHIDGYQTPFKMHKLWSYLHPNFDKDFGPLMKKHSVSPPSEEMNISLPPLLIINIMLPNYKPEMGKSGKTDGEGYQEVIYCHLTEQIGQKIVKNEVTPSIKLFSSFLTDESLQRSRFKIIARCMNGKYTKLGFVANKLIKKYNAKPFVAKTSTTYYYEKGKYFGIDIDIHSFGYAAKKGFDLIKDVVPSFIYDFGFVIEGCANDELPEQMLVTKRVSKMALDKFCRPVPDEIVQKFKK